MTYRETEGAIAVQALRRHLNLRILDGKGGQPPVKSEREHVGPYWRGFDRIVGEDNSLQNTKSQAEIILFPGTREDNPA